MAGRENVGETRYKVKLVIMQIPGAWKASKQGNILIIKHAD